MSAPPDSDPQESAASDRLPPGDPKSVGVPRSALRPPDLAIGVLIVIGFLLIGAIGVGIADPTLTDSDPDNDSAGGRLVSQAVLAIGLILTALGWTAHKNRGDIGDAASKLGLRRFGPRILIPMLIALVTYLVLAVIVASIFSPEQEDVAENLGADTDASVVVTVLAGILIVAGASLGEELFFRGFIFGGLRQSLSLWPAALISGAIFGFLHLSVGNVGVGIQLSIFGVVLAWLYERTGVLWAPILLHGANNSLAFYLLVTDKI